MFNRLQRLKNSIRLKRATVVSLIALSMVVLPAASNATLYEMRDYFESLGASYPDQSSSNLWTFQYGDHNGGMLTPSGANYLSSPYAYQQIGTLVPSGAAYWGGWGGE